MAKPTQGPWLVTASEDEEGGYHVVAEHALLDTVALVQPQPTDGEELANARLIAAAPELLNGCQALLGLLDLVRGRDDLPPTLREALLDNHRVAEAEAAIAKAASSSNSNRGLSSNGDSHRE